MTVREWIKAKILGLIGVTKENDAPDSDRLVFINNDEKLTLQRIHEYNLWYQGDGDELLNYYTHQNTIEYNYEPWYSRNKRNYFWAISSTESDIKRTHSGQPRNIVDTLVSIMPFPIIRAGALDLEEEGGSPVDKNLQAILKHAKVKELYKQRQMPLTLVEGWGCYKINWDKDASDYPILVYYRAENVDFIYQNDQMTGIIFKDYYHNGKRRFMLAETRRIESKYDEVLGKAVKNLIIEKQLFESNLQDSDYIKPVDFSAVPELKDVETYIEIGPYDSLFAVPCIFFENTSRTGGYGRSVFTGKIDLFDDLDQCLSQASNSVRKSTPIEYFNSDYLERDRNGMPKQPKAYDRKYSLYRGQKNADGSSTGDPVQVTQPAINFQQYTDHAVQILMQTVNGILSPATLGIDIAKKDNAEAQREKEKVTIFTRNTIIDSEEPILASLCSQLLCAYEFMHTNRITTREYDISIKYSEFADESFENKLEILGAAFAQENLSEDMYMQKLYGDTLSRADYKKELEWLKEHHTAPRDEGMEGIMGDGANMPGGPGAGGEMMSQLGGMLGGEQQ